MEGQNIVPLPSEHLALFEQPYEYKPFKEGEVCLLDLLPATGDDQAAITCRLLPCLYCQSPTF